MGTLVGLTAWLPLPHYLVQVPGPAIPTSSQLEIEGYPRTPDPGEFYITTLYQRPATLWWAMRAALQGDWELVVSDRSQPQSATTEPVDVDHRRLRQVIYDTCGLEPNLEITVLDLTKDSPLEGKVQPGDQLLKIDDTAVRQVRQVRDLVRRHPAGRPIHLRFAHSDGDVYEVETQPRKIAGLTDGPGLGVLLSSHWNARSLPEIRFQAANYEGNSSDLMLALDACERLLHLNLRRGRRIAGTGGLGLDGQVTAVQGLPQKLSSAQGVRAVLLLCPAEEASKLRNSSSMRIVPVSSLAEAIHILQNGTP